ncbi:ribosomal protein S12 methylthiotransferase RimO [Striga asiatica]|uniref:Ribosomal protein S12 methylthiotransferase RimO n=1 Tax=Striga asiatica TaxID=4170 RepID=A0A5A7PXR8_STRAF|nr:ribosomal protein S12 methylthiotransferase RimO [Striga asiatica]
MGSHHVEREKGPYVQGRVEDSCLIRILYAEKKADVAKLVEKGVYKDTDKLFPFPSASDIITVQRAMASIRYISYSLPAAIAAKIIMCLQIRPSNVEVAKKIPLLKQGCGFDCPDYSNNE